MKSRYFFTPIILFLVTTSFLKVTATFAQDATNSGQSFREKLNVPFGKIVRMGIEIVDGDKLDDKGYESSFLLKVKSVENAPLGKPLIFEFEDETGNFPVADFELYEHLYGKKTGEISFKISR